MQFCGWYDEAGDRYARSCGDMQCPRHGVGACRQTYHKKLKALKPGWGFFTFIVFFNKKPTASEVKSYRQAVRKVIRGWDREARICLPLHPKAGKWHLNVGVQSKWAFKMSNRHWLGHYVNDRIAGWWDGKRMRYARGAPRRADFHVMVRKLKDAVADLCANCGLKRRRPARLQAGKFRNQPKRWLWYVLRCKAGWPDDEKLPRKQGYRLVTGFVARGSKPAKPISPASSRHDPGPATAPRRRTRSCAPISTLAPAGFSRKATDETATGATASVIPPGVARGPPPERGTGRTESN
jgi:hypothetical protein